jgi:hypothetical protein
VKNAPAWLGSQNARGRTTAGRVNMPITARGLIDEDHIYDEVCTAYWCGLNQLTHARTGCDQAPNAGQARTGKRPVRRSQGYPWAETTAGIGSFPDADGRSILGRGIAERRLGTVPARNEGFMAR